MKLVVLIGLLQVLACDPRLVVASNTVSDDYTYDLSSPVYVALKAQLRRLRANNKPLRLKINSHPCAGKSYFIFKHKVGTGRKAPLEASFMGCQLLDFDDYVGANRTGRLLLSFPDNAVLLGSAHTEQFDLDDVAYVYVVPRRQRVKLNVKKRQYSGRRQKRLHDLKTWSNSTHIMLLRQRALARVFVRGAQRWPVFYAFEEAIRFCAKAYNSSVSYILLWGGRERDVHIEGTCQAKKLTSSP